MIYKKGLPTHIDVNKLRVAFGVPSPGDRILYAELEDITGLDKDTARFKTVVTAWRSKLDQESNIIFRAVPGECLEVLDGHGRIDVAGKKKKYGFRMMARATNIASRTDRSSLTSDELKTQDHLTGMWARIQLLDQVKSTDSVLDRLRYAVEG